MKEILGFIMMEIEIKPTKQACERAARPPFLFLKVKLMVDE